MYIRKQMKYFMKVERNFRSYNYAYFKYDFYYDLSIYYEYLG